MWVAFTLMNVVLSWSLLVKGLCSLNLYERKTSHNIKEVRIWELYGFSMVNRDRRSMVRLGLQTLIYFELVLTDSMFDSSE